LQIIFYELFWKEIDHVCSTYLSKGFLFYTVCSMNSLDDVLSLFLDIQTKKFKNLESNFQYEDAKRIWRFTKWRCTILECTVQRYKIWKKNEKIWKCTVWYLKKKYEDAINFWWLYLCTLDVPNLMKISMSMCIQKFCLHLCTSFVRSKFELILWIL